MIPAATTANSERTAASVDNRKQTNGKKMKTFLKTVDIFAKPIQLTYKGQDKFRTSFGGVLSVGVIILIVSLFAYNLRDLINRNRTEVKKNTLVTSTNSYSPPEGLS